MVYYNMDTAWGYPLALQALPVNDAYLNLLVANKFRCKEQYGSTLQYRKRDTHNIINKTW